MHIITLGVVLTLRSVRSYFVDTCSVGWMTAMG
jgi:hypothetical protein